MLRHHRVVCLAVVVGALLSSLAVSEAATTTPCQCEDPTSPGRANQLVRGVDQEQRCQDGFYCRCADRALQRCIAWWGSAWRFDEHGQGCVDGLDCRRFFDAATSTTGASQSRPTPPTVPVTATPEATTASSSSKSTTASSSSKPTAASSSSEATTASSYSKSTTASSSSEASAATTLSTSPPPPECSCEASPGRAEQLIRGPDQESQCRDGYYCRCGDGKRLRCGNLAFFIGRRFNEDSQACVAYFSFDCGAFFATATTPAASSPSAAPSMTTPAASSVSESPRTTTGGGGPLISTTILPSSSVGTWDPPQCSCDDNPEGRAFQLVRGTDQEQRCAEGFYCRCADGALQRCRSWWGPGWRYDEDGQACVEAFDCQRFFGSSEATPRRYWMKTT